MIIIWGTRYYGRILRSGSTFLATQFFHLWYLPLIPLGSHLVIEELGGGEVRYIEQKLSWDSVLAAYLRIWGIIVSIFLGFGLAAASDDGAGAMALAAVPFVLVAGATVFAWLRLGKLTPEEVLQRQVYERWCGLPIDPIQLRDGADGLAGRIREELARAAGEQGALGYRGNLPDEGQLPRLIAQLPDADARALSGALTLVRLEQTRTTDRAAQQKLEELHAELWRKLCAVEGRGTQARAA